MEPETSMMQLLTELKITPKNIKPDSKAGLDYQTKVAKFKQMALKADWKIIQLALDNGVMDASSIPAELIPIITANAENTGNVLNEAIDGAVKQPEVGSSPVQEYASKPTPPLVELLTKQPIDGNVEALSSEIQAFALTVPVEDKVQMAAIAKRLKELGVIK